MKNLRNYNIVFFHPRFGSFDFLFVLFGVTPDMKKFDIAFAITAFQIFIFYQGRNNRWCQGSGTGGAGHTAGEQGGRPDDGRIHRTHE